MISLGDSDVMSPGARCSLAANFWPLVAGSVNPWLPCLHARATAVAGEIDAMCVVDDTIQDRVVIRRIGNHVMPFVRGDLASEIVGRLFEEFEEVVARGGIEGYETPQSSRISSCTPPSARSRRA